MPEFLFLQRKRKLVMREEELTDEITKILTERDESKRELLDFLKQRHSATVSALQLEEVEETKRIVAVEETKRAAQETERTRLIEETKRIVAFEETKRAQLEMEKTKGSRRSGSGSLGAYRSIQV